MSSEYDEGAEILLKVTRVPLRKAGYLAQPRKLSSEDEDEDGGEIERQITTKVSSS